jgi:hypothetical protein
MSGHNPKKAGADMANRPPVWQMIKEAIDGLGGQASYAQIKEFIWKRHGNDVNAGTINAQILICTVNQRSRIHFPENKKPRLANSRYDFLYSPARGQVELYDPAKHGVWEIGQDEQGKLVIGRRTADSEIPVAAPTDVAESDWPETDPDITGRGFAFESHLRDFLARNLYTVPIDGRQLRLFEDENGRDGVEYPTDVGPIDILANDADGNFYVFELKLNTSADTTVGQVMRYMGWVKQKLANDKEVNGVIVAQNMSERLKYAVLAGPQI